MAGFLLDGVYYCHGGVDTKGKVLKEFIALNLTTFDWKKIPLITRTVDPEDKDDFDFNSEYIYGHQMCLVTQKRKYVTMKELGEMDYGLAPFFIKHEGVYAFGGVHRRTD